ncbi:hypothetical protein E3N88_07136 [Mikania micrantha]|uniref:Uncharacterized protein n=1 Tax=Mikania micrantha TaxID=192012 RepID=A0A5N6PT26_9ASTR|nr:hypothetical protein E3N88_07136 [Mikania micrantha]
MSVDHNSSRLCAQPRGDGHNPGNCVVHNRIPSFSWESPIKQQHIFKNRLKQDNIRERKIGSLIGTYNSCMESLRLARIQDSRLAPTQVSFVGHLVLNPDVQVKL